jgi:hypothetical protein
MHLSRRSVAQCLLASAFGLVTVHSAGVALAAPNSVKLKPDDVHRRAAQLAATFQSPVRGITVGPIENAYHPGLGYGSNAFAQTLDETSAMGGNWVALTPFGRVGSLAGLGVDPTFEAQVRDNQLAMRSAIRQAHARGLKVFLVPHLWVESYEWRALIDPKSDIGWLRWAESYSKYVLGWARIAREEQVEMLAAGVELRSWVTTTRAPLFLSYIEKLRAEYPGLLTYSSNWDDAEDTVIWRALDVIGINAFFPLADKPGATLSELRDGGKRVAEKVKALGAKWQKPVMFSEVGYTTRKDPAVEPWLWPDSMKNVQLSQLDQARAYHGLLSEVLAPAAADDAESFLGFFVWRTYSDPNDVSQEPEFGFSPRGKLSELVVRDAFATRGAAPWPAAPWTRAQWGAHSDTPGLLPRARWAPP